MNWDRDRERFKETHRERKIISTLLITKTSPSKLGFV